MKDNTNSNPVLPRHGYINELAELCNCNRKTVTRALFQGQGGKKAEMVRQLYRLKYGDTELTKRR